MTPQPTIPEDAVVATEARGFGIRVDGRDTRTSSVYSRGSYPSPQRSVDSAHSSVFDGRRPVGLDGPASPATTDNRTSIMSATLGEIPGPRSSTPQQQQLIPTPPYVHSVPVRSLPYPSDPEPVNLPVEYFDGLMTVEAETAEASGAAIDCTLRGDASIYQYKGLCEGARDVLRGGLGVKKTKKPSGFTATSTVAKCTNCCFELDYRQIELDVNHSDQGNFVSSGITFRIRFLQKSHVATKRSDESLYACLFCVHTGKTLEDSDATVFFTQKQLFAHLARHLRPLPHVDGLVVIEGDQVPAQNRNNYDLHVREPVRPNPVTEKRADLVPMPTATAKETVKRMYGMKLLADRTAALELAGGAKIVGVEFMPQYGGEWCMGWHDGIRASFPLDVVRLEAPPLSDFRMGGTSGLRAIAKWRFNMKDKGSDWLKFDKEEVITNITFPYQEHWCWCGTNSKGKWGIFPQAFLDANSLYDTSSGSDRASLLSNENSRVGKRRIGGFSLRKTNSGRPGSIGGSSSSREAIMSPKKPTVY